MGNDRPLLARCSSHQIGAACATRMGAEIERVFCRATDVPGNGIAVGQEW